MGVVLVLSGPSGSGKSSLINSVKDELGDYYFSISTTSREPRGQEVDGREYFFVSKDEFKKDIAEGAFLEYAKVHGNYYGTSLKNVYDALSENKMVLFDIDVQGHDSLKNILGDIMTSVFITPPTSQTLEKRLRTRATDDEDVIQKRLLQANDEIKKIHEYDYFIINDDLDKAKDEFLNIVKAAKLKKPKQFKDYFIKEWI